MALENMNKKLCWTIIMGSQLQQTKIFSCQGILISILEIFPTYAIASTFLKFYKAADGFPENRTWFFISTGLFQIAIYKENKLSQQNEMTSVFIF